ncbi:TIGR03089 family protein [Saccharopolyspora rectivirgula]|jgi:uncharacterized protein (TIGR03089 family)|uniref:Acetyl-CoA synthetase n=1 Tax=Saccharopolyspora rectivirgula TaxID=28042 RepID=A0A073BEB4_9PSEU|nr:TIGR03089 family protein [Saccharopolyspora rectivirgula]KEI46094.1 hypothetical protein GU90_00105 [Saccharopolyspora rectivirgula]
MSVTRRLLEPLLTADAPRPLITHYDDATGARIELSRLTAANWAAKTANWLVNEIDLEPGTPVVVALPAHWQTVGVLLGAWWCGAHLIDQPAEAEVAFVPADDLERGAGAFVTAAVGLDALGAPLSGLPSEVVDYVSDIRVHADEFSGPEIAGDQPALGEFTVDEVVTRAADRAAELGISSTDRILSTKEWDGPDGIIDGLLSVLAARASLVQCTNVDPTKLERREQDERVTKTLG